MIKKQLSVGLVGLGEVGLRVAQSLYASKNAPYQLSAVCVPDGTENLDWLPGVEYTRYFEKLTRESPSLDVVVIALSGAGLSYEVAADALENGKHIIVRDPLLLAVHGENLMTLAHIYNRQIFLEGALHGALALSPLLMSSQAHKMVFTPACQINRVLARMETHAEEREEAMAALYTSESELETESKMLFHQCILMRALAFGVWSDLTSHSFSGIQNVTQHDVKLAHQLGYSIRLVGTATHQTLSFAPQLVLQADAELFDHGEGFQLLTEFGEINLSLPERSTHTIVQGVMNDLSALATTRPYDVRSILAKTETVQPTAAAHGQYFVRLPEELRTALPTDGCVQVIEERVDQKTGTSGVMLRASLSRQGLMDILDCEEAVVLPVTSDQLPVTSNLNK